MNESTLSAVSEARDWLAGGGEMGGLIRGFDWESTPLGPPEAWPLSLKTAVRLMLSSRYPMVVWWGRELTNFYNDAYAVVCGRRHPWAILGKPASEVWHEAWHIVGPLADIVINESKAIWNEELLLILERNGYAEETYFTFSYSPAPDDTGAVGGVFCVITEETAKVLGQRRFRTLQALAAHATGTRSPQGACELAIAALAGNSKDVPFAAIYLLDSQGTRAHREATAGLHPGHPLLPAEIPINGAHDPWRFERAIVTGEPVQIDGLDRDVGPIPGGAWPEAPHTALVVPITQPGQALPAGFLIAGISARLTIDDEYRSFLTLAGSHIANAVANARAYEEQRQRAEALAEIDRVKTAFFSNVSHELRTPLTLMLGPLEDELAEHASPLPPARRQRIEMAHRNTVRLLKLVNSLLDFTRIDAGHIQASYEATDLAVCTADLASMFRSAAEKAGLTLAVDCPPLPELVYVDRDMWEKVVLNLLSNAFKHTFQGGIAVTLRWCGEYAELAVTDSGAGIPEAEIPHLFDRFHRVKGTKSRHEGTGIGLALVQELVRAHGGTVGVRSREGLGSTFAVRVKAGRAHLPAERIGPQHRQGSAATLAAAYVEEAGCGTAGPLADSMAWPGSTTAWPGPAPKTGTAASQADETSAISRPKILWADDNADMREYVCRLLSEFYDVTVVSDGSTALTTALALQPDLILTDVMMPGLDGFGLLRELRRDERTRTIPIILLSARAGEEASVEGLQTGADDYIIKPFSARELLARVRTHLEMAKLRREGQERLSLAQRAGRVGVFDWDLATGRAVWTRELEAIFGLPAGGFEGSWASWARYVYPEDLPQVEALLAEWLGSARDEIGFEYRIILPGGQLRWIDAGARVVRGPDGKPLRVVGTNLDVTERKRAMEEKIIRLADMVESSNDAIMCKTPEGIITSWNSGAERIYGYTRDEALGHSVEMLIPPERHHELQQILDGTRRGESVQHFETTRLRKDGQCISLSLTISPIRDGRGLIVGASTIARDITKSKVAEAEIQRLNDNLRKNASNLDASNKELEAFSYSVSHDLRAPLRYLGGFLELLKNHLGGGLDEKGRHYLDVLLDSAAQMGALIDDLLKFARMGRVEMSETRVDLAHLVKQVQEELAAHLNGRTVVWTVEPLPEVAGDPALLRQVLVNLLGNAIKYTCTRAEAAIEIGCREEGGEWVFFVRDNGVGFDMQYVHKLFGVFQRLHSGDDFEGTGIGLAIVQRVIARHGGRTWAEGVVDQGSTFYFSLPRAAAAAKGDTGAGAGRLSQSRIERSIHHVSE